MRRYYFIVSALTNHITKFNKFQIYGLGFIVICEPAACGLQLTGPGMRDLL